MLQFQITPTGAAPEPTNSKHYRIAAFDVLKEQLGTSKTAMDDHFEGRSRDDFAKFWKEFDPFRHERVIAANMGNTMNVSNSWLKCHELVAHFHLFVVGRMLVHVDNAALPGAFIANMHHNAMVTNTPYTWFASSLHDVSGGEERSPQLLHETRGAGRETEEQPRPRELARAARDQRPAYDTSSRTMSPLKDKYRLFANYPAHWLMTEKNNGDVLIPANQSDFQARLADKGVNLYTSDLGFDVSSDYNKQEQMHLPVNCGQILTGLLTLQHGGNFLIKQYTTFEPATIGFMFALSHMFDEFFICKPVTSRVVNSETYLVGRGFRKNAAGGTSANLLTAKYTDAFFARIRGDVEYDVPMFALADYSAKFLAEITKFSSDLCARQIKLIEQNIKLTLQTMNSQASYKVSPRDAPIVVEAQRKHAAEIVAWYVKYPILPIAHRDMLRMKDNLRQGWATPRKRRTGHENGRDKWRRNKRSSSDSNWRRRG